MLLKNNRKATRFTKICLPGQVLDSWTATGQVWTCLDSDFSNFWQLGHGLDPKPTTLQNDNRIRHHLAWIK